MVDVDGMIGEEEEERNGERGRELTCNNGAMETRNRQGRPERGFTSGSSYLYLPALLSLPLSPLVTQPVQGTPGVAPPPASPSNRASAKSSHPVSSPTPPPILH